MDVEIDALFLVLFVWRVPHLLAIAWINRADYRRARLCMRPAVDPDGSMIGRQLISYWLALIAASLVLLMMRGAGLLGLAGALPCRRS